jgi:hypothetical protein
LDLWSSAHSFYSLFFRETTEEKKVDEFGEFFLAIDANGKDA